MVRLMAMVLLLSGCSTIIVKDQAVEDATPILTLGDEEARTMGINAKRLRSVVILCATLITAAAVSVSGVIGWVGLVIPHLTRRMVGNSYRHLMPASMLFGAIFLLLVDNVSRNLFATEIPIGILTSFIGAPFFIYLITRDGERL